MLNDHHVAVFCQKGATYPDRPPFHSSRDYPECPFKGHFCFDNAVYDSVRNVLHYLRIDKQNYGSPHWNPLRSIVSRENVVLVKPNMIAHSHRYPDAWEQVITRGSVLRAAIDFVFLALGGEGRIVIADAPQTDSKMDLIKDRMGIHDIQDL